MTNVEGKFGCTYFRKSGHKNLSGGWEAYFLESRLGEMSWVWIWYFPDLFSYFGFQESWFSKSSTLGLIGNGI
ncbi:MAG: hypothetical protein DF168_01901 [Candidatus Moanabacter tarae]|uniref:Uncharacterized protein n=1 Tax=Candidatus Moanibacter tarae TaxID=2200854 RepID=A0A2Z4AEE6_9BACT|nr:MAG: hypothetical protein DF168_01901 [Candidatus Moanabacter tarae]